MRFASPSFSHVYTYNNEFGFKSNLMAGVTAREGSYVNCSNTKQKTNYGKKKAEN